MDCVETPTDWGKGRWGDHPARYALSTIRRTFGSRHAPGARTTEAFRFSYRLQNGHASLREFPTAAERDAFLERSISDQTAAEFEQPLLSGCDSEQWRELIGDRLAGVVFVADYMQLQFDGGTTNFYAWPTVLLGQRSFSVTDEGYRDALCSLIDRRVAGADTFIDDGFVIVFDGGELAISPDQVRDAPYPEVVEGHGGAISWAQPPFDE